MSENVIRYDGNNPAMEAAMQHARDTFKFFWRELSWEYRRIVPAFDMTMIKVGLPTDSKDRNACKVEHIWASEIEYDGKLIKGVLINQPNWISNLNESDEISIPLSELEDWMITCNNKVYGGFTVHQMRLQMSSAEMREHDSAWGLDFGDPKNPRIIIEDEREEGSKGFFSKLFGKKEAKQSKFDFANPPEHQMSRNMAAKIQEAISENPEVTTQTDHDGWTMLHREALAGNLTPVKILLANGADRNAKNQNGHTPIDLAKLMGWPSVIDALKTSI